MSEVTLNVSNDRYVSRRGQKRLFAKSSFWDHSKEHNKKISEAIKRHWKKRKVLFPQKGKTLIARKCLNCSKSFFALPCKIVKGRGKFCSRICCDRYPRSETQKKRMSLARIGRFKGEKCPSWKGEKVQYGGIHAWLKDNFGKPEICQNTACLKRSSIFEWAKVLNKPYARRRENFVRLCRSCHRRYDGKQAKFIIIGDLIY